MLATLCNTTPGLICIIPNKLLNGALLNYKNWVATLFKQKKQYSKQYLLPPFNSAVLNQDCQNCGWACLGIPKWCIVGYFLCALFLLLPLLLLFWFQEITLWVIPIVYSYQSRGHLLGSCDLWQVRLTWDRLSVFSALVGWLGESMGHYSFLGVAPSFIMNF